jgi:hypothetical protein
MNFTFLILLIITILNTAIFMSYFNITPNFNIEEIWFERDTKIMGKNETWSSEDLTPEMKKIFFLETNDALEQVRPTALCAMESAALNNPSHEVFMVVNVDSLITSLPEQFKTTLNMHILRINFSEFVKDLAVGQVFEVIKANKRTTPKDLRLNWFCQEDNLISKPELLKCLKKNTALRSAYS